MDQQAPTNSIEKTEDFMDMIKLMDPLLVESYRKFLHEVLTQGLSHHNFTFNTLNKCLMNYTQDCMKDMISKAISFYEMEAPGNVRTWVYS